MAGTGTERLVGRWRWTVLGGALLVLAGAGGYVAYQARQPRPPAVDLSGADPVVAHALAEALAAVRATPHAAAWGRLGQMLLCYSIKPEAATSFARAEQLDPREPRWPYLYALAVVHADPDDALRHLRRAAELCGTDPPAVRLRLAELLEAQGDLDGSAAEFRRVLAHDPDDARAHLGLARLAYDRNDLAAVLPHLDQAVTSPIAQRQAYTLRAEVRQRLGDRDAADRDREAAAKVPEDPPPPDPFGEEVEACQVGKQRLLQRLDQLKRQGRMDEARALANQVEHSFPDVYWLVEGRTLRDRGDLPGSVRAYREALKLAPDWVDASQDLGDVYLRQGKTAEAVTTFRKVLELEPDFGPAHQALAECCLRQDDLAGAVRELREAAQLLPHRADVHRDLGELLARQGHTEEALVQLRQAVQLAPGDGKARTLLEQVGQGKAP
jgi:tetratricopeptide (TPR) repeat protein